MSATGDAAPEATRSDPSPGWLDGPVSRGLVLALLTANLALVGWMFQRQGEALERLEGSVGSPMQWHDTVGVDDQELCWVLGSLARAQGKGNEMTGLLSGSANLTNCVMGAQRGAMGQRPDGS